MFAAEPGSLVSTATDVPARWTTVVVTVIAATFTGAGLGVVAVLLEGSDAELWLVARASGLMSYALLTVVTVTGIVLSMPHRAVLRWWAPVLRLRTHIALTVFALAFTVLHIVVLAVDPWAKVGWAGALLPLGAEYRPVPVTLGLISLWAGLIAGVSAALAGRGTGGWWRRLHRLAAVAWILAWLHGVFAGSDTAPLMGMYAVTGLAVILAATLRYSAARRVRARSAQVRTAMVKELAS